MTALLYYQLTEAVLFLWCNIIIIIWSTVSVIKSCFFYWCHYISLELHESFPAFVHDCMVNFFLLPISNLHFLTYHLEDPWSCPCRFQSTRPESQRIVCCWKDMRNSAHKIHASNTCHIFYTHWNSLQILQKKVSCKKQKQCNCGPQMIFFLFLKYKNSTPLPPAGTHTNGQRDTQMSQKVADHKMIKYYSL